MNINTLLHRVKKELGIGQYLKITKSDEELKDIIVDISLKDFSRYFKNTVYLNNKQFTQVDFEQGLYTIPLPDGFRESMAQHGVVIKGIKELKRNPKYTGYPIGNTNWVSLPGSYHQMSADYSARAATAFEYSSSGEINDVGYKCQFVYPDKLRFLDNFVNYQNINFDIHIFTSHSNNLSTIGDNIALPFETLVKLDLKRILYDSELKFIDGLETTSMTVQLKIDNWANAEADREVLLKEFEDSRISSTPMVII